MTLGLGIAGLGTAGVAMLGAAFGHDGIAVVAVADTDMASLDLGSSSLPRRYDSLDRMLEDDYVEAVHIATPTPAHFEHVTRALAAGRHVVVEKPVTASTGEAARLAACATASRRVVVVGHSETFEPYARAVRRAVADGEIGQPTMLMAEKATDWMRRPRLPAEWDATSGGGIIRRQGVHQVDVVRSVLGCALTVREAGVRADPQRGVPGGYFAWLSGDKGERAFLTHDGVGRLADAAAGGVSSAARATGTSGSSDEVAKRSRRAELVRRVVAERAAIPLGARDWERLVVLGQYGEIVASSRHADVLSSEGTRRLDLAAYPEGRHAVLDELVAAVSGTAPVVHDIAWGMESLRICEDIERLASAA